MILYKYVSFNSAVNIIKGKSLGFTCLEDLNDPFEGTNFGFSSLGDVTPRAATRGFKNHFSHNYAVLSLTRNPLNSLMWAHYGDSHKGIVIGIDIELANLTSSDEFIIPAQLGEITYVSTKNKDLNRIPSIDKLNEIKESDLKFKSDIKSYLKQAFLYKSLEWGYEEEVRVIKSLIDFNFSYHNPLPLSEVLSDVKGSRWDKLRNNVLGQPLFCFNIPENAIKEVYLGACFYRNMCRSNEEKDKELHDEQLDYFKVQNFDLFVCEPDYSGWNLSASLVNKNN
ncbi:DUF2971 domain-containing protein [uncultured Psychromonas sp.]|uniref:DUF2971 domain-containing protein n=1 Tax=uncultured Psychromonas sp. TaxID=173974 RepID=UPI00261FF6B5|nr:DUF2971 domain-containing protein [uncultured Psychromonas sp.]